MLTPSRRTSQRPLPAGSAEAARLRYVTDAGPGLRRRRVGSSFRYEDERGRPVRSAATLRRIRALAVPPAWREVWICPDSRGHLQATGRDARGRKQHRYHPRWHEVRDEHKFHRLLAFGRALPALRRRVSRALALTGLPREKVVATIVLLLDETCLRVGNDEYARSNDSFGLTTLHDRHVAVRGGELLFEFRGKSGKLQRCQLRDPRVARIVARCQSLPGAELFQYVDERGRRHRVGSADVNDFLRSAIGEEFSAKDFRTWAGSAAFLAALHDAAPARSATARRHQVLTAIDRAAAQLRNTRAVCRRSYVHPALIEAFEKGAWKRRRRTPSTVRGLSADERRLLEFLAELPAPPAASGRPAA